jgi:hypothetical protein
MKYLTLILSVVAWLGSPLAWAEKTAQPEAQVGVDKPAPLRIWKSRKHPPIENPIFVRNDLMGGWSEGKWTRVDPGKVDVPDGQDPTEQVRVTGLFKKGTKLRFFRDGKRAGQTRATEVLYSVGQMDGSMNLNLPDWPEGATVALAGDWAPLPRKITRGQKTQVQNAVAELLAKNGVKKATHPVITRVDRVDVDNDGVDDFFVIATREKSYELVALVTPEKNRMITISFRKDDEEASLGYIELFDANGDGKLEIFVEFYALESHWTALYEVRDDQAVSVFSEK